MNLQDILTLASGPQGWLLIGGGILLLLVLLVYWRIGKVAAATRTDLAEMRQTMAQLTDRLDAVHEALTASSATDGGERVSLALAGSIAAEDSEAAVEDTYGYDMAQGTEDDTDLTGAGAAFTPDAVSELSDELPGVADETEASVEDTCGYAMAQGTEDGTDLTEVGAAFPADAVSELSDELPGFADEPEASVEDAYGYAMAQGTEDGTDLTEVGAAFPADAVSEPSDELPGVADEPEAPVEDAYGYDMAQGTEDATALTEAGAVFSPDAVSELTDELPGFAEESEASVEDTYGYDMVPGIEDGTDLNTFEETPMSDVDGELPGELQDPVETREDFDEFQFSAAASLAGTDREASLETELGTADELEPSCQSFEESESFTFGSGGLTPEGEEADLVQAESREELLPDFQSSTDDVAETTSQTPGEIAIDSAAPSQSASQVSSLEPLPGDPDQPQVGVARCGECGRKIAYPKRLSGKRMRCPACRATSILP